jgi:hypothetical protein
MRFHVDVCISWLLTHTLLGADVYQTLIFRLNTRSSVRAQLLRGRDTNVPLSFLQGNNYANHPGMDVNQTPRIDNLVFVPRETFETTFPQIDDAGKIVS